MRQTDDSVHYLCSCGRVCRPTVESIAFDREHDGGSSTATVAEVVEGWVSCYQCDTGEVCPEELVAVWPRRRHLRAEVLIVKAPLEYWRRVIANPYLPFDNPQRVAAEDGIVEEAVALGFDLDPYEEWGHATEAEIVKAALEYLDTEAVQTETCPACRRVVPRLVESPDDPYSVCQGCRDEIAVS